MSQQVLLVGGDSQIAGVTASHLRARGYGVMATTRRRDAATADRPFLNLAAPANNWPIPEGIDAVCLCAAIARLSDCARDPLGSAQVNVAGTIALVDRLLAHDIPVLFLSTDKVFDGTRPHVPAATPHCPVSEYGRQKAMAEAALLERMAEGRQVSILRLAKVVAPNMELLRRWIHCLSGGKSIRAFDDMVMAPMPEALVAATIARLLAEPISGIFQLTGPRDIAYSDVADHLARCVGADPALVKRVSAYSAGLPPGSTAQHTTLDSSALRERFGIVAPDVWEVIDSIVETCR